MSSSKTLSAVYKVAFYKPTDALKTSFMLLTENMLLTACFNNFFHYIWSACAYEFLPSVFLLKKKCLKRFMIIIFTITFGSTNSTNMTLLFLIQDILIWCTQSHLSGSIQKYIF